MRIGGYEVERSLGRGGMAEVLLARVVGGPHAGRPVALKRLLPPLAAVAAYRELFAREASLAARLRHPNVVEVLGAGVDGGAPYLALEYVDGCDVSALLRACVARGVAVPLPFALHLAHQVARALQHVHAARDADGRPLGAVHCDVSPSNVFVARTGAVKLGDFGVAQVVGEAAGAGRAPAVLGKVRYTAPERLRGEPAGPAADVFALGAVLFELLTLRPAFPGRDAAEVRSAILCGAPRPPSAERPEVPPEIDALVLRALAAEGRTATAGALAEALAARYDPTVGTPLAIAALVRGVVGP